MISELKALVAAIAVTTSASGQLIAHPSTAELAVVASGYPADLRLPPYAGTAVYRFSTRARFRTILESDGMLFAIATVPNDSRATMLQLKGKAFGIVSLPEGPFVSLVVREIDLNSVIIEAVTPEPKARKIHFILTKGAFTLTTIRGSGLQTLPGSGVRCLDARRSSAFNGAALIVIDQPSGDLRPSIPKSALSAPTADTSSNLSYALSCHAFGSDLILWLSDTVATPSADRPAGISLFAAAHVRPLVNVAPVATSEHYILFEQGDPLDDVTPLTYTLVRSN